MGRSIIKIGSWTVDAAVLRGITIEDAYKLFPKKNKKRVEAAWKEANPERERPTPKAPAVDEGKAVKEK